MVTPFAASPGTDRVGRSSPGAWLLLRPRPADGAWTPWGRLECWRDDRGDLLAYRFHHLVGAGVCVAESAVSAARGGRFAIDLTGASADEAALFGAGGGGFVMAADVQGEGRRRRASRPSVEVGVAHVGCAEDAAAFVALAAAVDLSVDACRLFSSCRLLRREVSWRGGGGLIRR
ncbi:hypothetical protein U9M48_011618 [Paspalum notatum var. saurae]|uniref:Uncharacterized protein n=1 Tax=Paspalum notatum var. saurae TaxID=547442 RepID=A0AAQ3SXF0_PASNO